MCGIAGLIHRGTSGDVGEEMTSMLQSLRHRGPDSTGFALYGSPDAGHYVMRFKVAEQEDLAKGFRIHQQMRERSADQIRRRLGGTRKLHRVVFLVGVDYTSECFAAGHGMRVCGMQEMDGYGVVATCAFSR